MKKDCVLILDFGSQYTQLITRKIRELQVFSKILYPDKISSKELQDPSVKGIILSGGPSSIYEENSLSCPPEILKGRVPVLGICYGMQILVHELGGKVQRLKKGEYGKTTLQVSQKSLLFEGFSCSFQVWMSHGDTVLRVPEGFVETAHNEDRFCVALEKHPFYGVQFHPEVHFTEFGKEILSHFVFDICRIQALWKISSFLEESKKEIRDRVGKRKVLCALSGGIDSAVTARLIQESIGDSLQCVFVDNGLLRLNESQKVQKQFRDQFRMNLTVIEAQNRFLKSLIRVLDPEEKRKIIGHEFIRVFEEFSEKYQKQQSTPSSSSVSSSPSISSISSIDPFLAQGTLYPDLIESYSPQHPSVKIKSHHNVGGLPEVMKFQLIEPLKELFKDEVRLLGKELGLSEEMLERHPFPGPGLAVRILGEVTKDRLNRLRLADAIWLEEIQEAGLYRSIWQAFVVLIPVKTVGVMGDSRSYEELMALRAIHSTDGMTAQACELPYSLLFRSATRITNEVQGVNRVVFDLSSKPPATIEWE